VVESAAHRRCTLKPVANQKSTQRNEIRSSNMTCRADLYNFSDIYIKNFPMANIRAQFWNHFDVKVMAGAVRVMFEGALCRQTALRDIRRV